MDTYRAQGHFEVILCICLKLVCILKMAGQREKFGTCRYYEHIYGIYLTL